MAAKPPAKQPKAPKEKKVGTVEHYYPKVHAASVGLEGDLKLGDKIHIKGHGDDLRENVVSMQIDHVPIQEGHAGQHIGLEVPMKVHKKAEVYKVAPGAAAKPKKAEKAKKTAKAPKARTAPKKAKKAPKRKKAAKKSGKRKSAKKAKSHKSAKKGKAKGRKSKR